MRNILTLVLAAFLVIPQSFAAPPTGSLDGRVIPSAGGAAATTVWVAPSGVSQQALQATVAADGTFRLDGVPAGTAQLAVETSEGLYVVGAPLAIAPGATRTVQLALGGRDAGTKPPAEEKKRTGTVWDNPLTATLVVVGSAIVVGLLVNELTKDDSNPPAASPSTVE